MHISKVIRDGVSLAYGEAGSGGPPMVLVHGWGGNKRIFDPQIAHFSKDHRVLALDLRGMGDSDAPDSGYELEQLADDVYFICERLSVEQPVLVGQSMGGVVVTILAAKRPNFARGVVMLDSAIVQTHACKDAFAAGVKPLRGPEYKAFLQSFVPALFAPIDNPFLRTQIVEALMGTPQHVLAAAWDSTRRTDASSAAAQMSVPALYVRGALSFLNDAEKLQEILPNLMMGQTIGSGHYHTLEVPDQVNAMIDRFVSLVIEQPDLISG